MDAPSAASSWPIRMALVHPWHVVGTWCVVMVASSLLVGTLLGDSLNADESITNGPESMRALDLIDDHPPEHSGADEVLVVASDQHRVGTPAFDAFLARLVAAAPVVGVTLAGANEGDPGAPGSPGGPPVSDDGHALLIPLAVEDEQEGAVVADRLVDAVREFDDHPDFEVDATGRFTVDHDLTELSERDLRDGELYVGLPAAMVVLLLVFGSVVGALLPLIVAVAAIVAALALTALVGLQWELRLFVVNMITGMGLALGIDYSLFVVSRYREERAAGSARDAAIRTTGATASRAVLFSGMTFVVALTGMLLVPSTIMRSLAAGAILVGITSVLASLTLLPASLHLLGDRVDSLRLPGPWRGRRATGASAERGFWAWLVPRVMRRPLAWGGAVTVLLLLAALPLADMRTGAAGVSTFPASSPSRQGYEALARHFPEQAFAPARIAVHEPGGIGPGTQRRIEQLRDELAEDDRFGAVLERRSNDDELAVVEVAVGGDSLSAGAVAAVRDLRSQIVPPVFGDATQVRVLVTGDTALNIDYFDTMREWLPIVLGFVLTLSFLILLVVFRSLVVPTVAIVLNLLSVGATYGLLVLVFQHGIGAELLGVRQVPSTEAWVPLFLFSVLFGLSMDYHMFLLTRIREQWTRTGDTPASVAWAVASTGRLITGAALIIVAVFLGFAVGDLVMFQQMGLGIAAALLIDATLVRGVMLPAAMSLLGEHNWYLPRALAWLPEVQLERDTEHRGARHRHV